MRVLLSVVWFFLLGALGVFFPFYSLYLREEVGLTGTQVGAVLATMPLVGMAAQPLWGHFADRSGRRSRTVTVLAFGAAAGYALLSVADGFAAVWLATAALAVFSTSLLPQSISLTLMATQRFGRHSFGLVRVWGTVGFLVTVVGFPFVLERLRAAGHSVEMSTMLVVASALALIAALVLTRVSDAAAPTEKARSGQWRELIGNRPYRRLLIFVFAAYLTLQGPMALFPIFVRSIGGDLSTVSAMWVLMLIVEVPLVAASGSGFARLGARALLGIGVGAGAFRWIVCGTTDIPALIYAVQLLHGVTVTGLILGAPMYVHAVVPEELRATAQGVLAMVGVSLGGTLSNLVSGRLMDAAGASAPALVGGLLGVALALATPWLLPRAARPAVPPKVEELAELPG